MITHDPEDVRSMARTVVIYKGGKVTSPIGAENIRRFSGLDYHAKGRLDPEKLLHDEHKEIQDMSRADADRYAVPQDQPGEGICARSYCGRTNSLL